MNAFQDFELGAKLYLQCLCNEIAIKTIEKSSKNNKNNNMKISNKICILSFPFCLFSLCLSFSFLHSVTEQLALCNAIVYITRESCRCLSAQCHRPLSGECVQSQAELLYAHCESIAAAAATIATTSAASTASATCERRCCCAAGQQMEDNTQSGVVQY